MQKEQLRIQEGKVAEYPFDKKKLIQICIKNDVSSIGLFGSMVRGEDNSSSDIDLLVKLSKKKSLLSMVKLENELTRALGRKVDLLTEAAISPYLQDRIKREVQVIHES